MFRFTDFAVSFEHLFLSIPTRRRCCNVSLFVISVAPKETADASGDKSMPEVEGEPGANREGEEDEDTDSMEGSGLYSLTEDGERESEGGRREKAKEKDNAKRAARKRNRLGGSTNHSSSSDDDDDDDDEEEQKVDEEDDDDDDDEAMEAWLKAEVCDLRGPVWQAVPSLRSREIGKDSHQFVRRVCGARGLVQRLELQGRLERHTGCVNTLHFNPSGTRLASGSDDLRVVIWDWAIRRAELEFDSGHKSNVFQVREDKEAATGHSFHYKEPIMTILIKFKFK